MSTSVAKKKENQTSLKTRLQIQDIRKKISLPALGYTNPRAVVVLSGGQDSTTALFWALETFTHVKAVHFQYGQSHGNQEATAVRKIAEIAGVTLDLFPLNALRMIGGGSLTNPNINVMSPHPVFPWLPGSFVPGRNLVFLSLTAAFALSLGYPNLVTGVCQTDYSGYPDCRSNFIDSMEAVIEDAIGFPNKQVTTALSQNHFHIWTPLMNLSKAESVVLAKSLGKKCMEALSYSHTCYKGQFPPCGVCPACELREKGFKEAKTKDPLKERKNAKS